MSDKTKAELKEQIKIMNHNYQVIREMHEKGYQYSVSEIKRLQDELEHTRKALDVARHTIGWINQMIDEHTDKQAIKIKCEYALDQIKQITESPAENVQTDTKSRPVNVQITYTADGITRTFFGKKCKVEFDVPPETQTHITITETKE